ncbi:MAG: hypothetical protein ACHQRM_12280 [Bacteroidia bacterium]
MTDIPLKEMFLRYEGSLDFSIKKQILADLNEFTPKIILDHVNYNFEVKGESSKWIYDADDEDMQDNGQEFSKMLKVPFDIVSA